MNTKQLMDEVSLLPLEERAKMVNVLLQSLNTPETEIDHAWLSLAKKRLNELRKGKESMDGEEVFQRIWKRFEV